jgi:hypothetical protein
MVNRHCPLGLFSPNTARADPNRRTLHRLQSSVGSERRLANRSNASLEAEREPPRSGKAAAELRTWVSSARTRRVASQNAERAGPDVRRDGLERRVTRWDEWAARLRTPSESSATEQRRHSEHAPSDSEHPSPNRAAGSNEDRTSLAAVTRRVGRLRTPAAQSRMSVKRISNGAHSAPNQHQRTSNAGRPIARETRIHSARRGTHWVRDAPESERRSARSEHFSPNPTPIIKP